MAFSRELLEVALPFPKGIPMHDSWLGILGEQLGTVYVLGEVSYCYRVHGANISHRQVPRRVQLIHRVRLLFSLTQRIFAYRFKSWGAA